MPRAQQLPERSWVHDWDGRLAVSGELERECMASNLASWPLGVSGRCGPLSLEGSVEWLIRLS